MEEEEGELRRDVVRRDLCAQVAGRLQREGTAVVKLDEQRGAAVVAEHCLRLVVQPAVGERVVEVGDRLALDAHVGREHVVPDLELHRHDGAAVEMQHVRQRRAELAHVDDDARRRLVGRRRRRRVAALPWPIGATPAPKSAAAAVAAAWRPSHSSGTAILAFVRISAGTPAARRGATSDTSAPPPTRRAVRSRRRSSAPPRRLRELNWRTDPKSAS